MFGTYIIMPEVPSFVGRELDDFLRFRGERYIAGYDCGRAGLDDLFHLEAYRLEAQAQVLQDRGSYAFALFYQSEQYMLGPDVIVVEPLGLFLRKDYHLPRPFGKS